QRGTTRFYRESGGSYRNPHESQIIMALEEAMRRWTMDRSDILDLAAGSGEITLALRDRGASQVTGVDPYTFEAFRERTGQIAEQLSFEQIAEGALCGRRYSLIV